MQAKNGDRVKVHYTLKDANGQVVETSKDFLPIEFVIGEGKVIPGFEKGILGMKKSEIKSVTIPPADAYGFRDEKKVFEYDKKKAPPDFSPKTGDTVKMHRADGNSVPVMVLDVTEKFFIMDANHPLAGKELVFVLELLEIETK